MKKLAFLIALIILTNILFSCKDRMVTDNTKVSNFITKNNLNDQLKGVGGFSKVEENDYLELYVDGASAEIAIKDKASGKMWYSNPQNTNDDKIASGDEVSILSSQIQLKYYDRIDNSFSINNYADSISLGQYELAKIDNGLRITFDIGQKGKIILAPKAIEKGRMATFVSKMSPDQKSYLKDKYQYLTIKGKDGLEKETLLKQYPSLDKIDIYVVASNFADFIMEKIAECFVSVGYTEKDLKKDNSQNIIELPATPISFTVSVDYTLEGKNFSARIPADKVITGNNSVKLTDISLLKFFGSAGLDDKGYIFVPDGSGAVINLNDDKTQFNSYSVNVYGRDHAKEALTRPYADSNCYMPVFGIKKNDDAFYAIIEKGEALSTINADISKKNNSYNIAYPTINVLDFDKVNTAIDKSKQMNKYQYKPYQGDFKVIYGFLSGDDANYSGMAIAYQDYLVRNKALNKVKQKEKSVFYLSILGSVDIQSSFVGIPVVSKKSLTKYDEATQILEKLKGEGVSDIALQYKYWSNNGIVNTVFSKPKLVDKLGGKDKFNELVKYLKNNKIDFFPNADFMYVFKNSFFDSFNSYRDESRYISEGFAYKYEYDLPTNKAIKESRRYIVSPRSLGKYVTSFLKGYNMLDLNGLSVNEMGTDLSSDYNKSKTLLRDKSQEIIVQQAKKIIDDGNKLMTSGANAYMLKYASAVIDSPMQSSNYYILDKSVPFYQIVLSGYIPYSTTPLNYTSDYRLNELKAIELGASPHFEWTYVDNSELKNTFYDFNSVFYVTWLEQATKSYQKINSVNSRVIGSRIISHNEVLNKVFETKYENDVTVYVNYNSTSVNYNGITILATNYVVKGGKQ